MPACWKRLAIAAKVRVRAHVCIDAECEYPCLFLPGFYKVWDAVGPPLGFLHTVREQEKEKRLNWHRHTHKCTQWISFPCNRSKKRLLFTLHLSKHCALPSGKRGRVGLQAYLLKNKSLMKIEINPHCRGNRGSGVKARQLFTFSVYLPPHFIENGLFWSKFKKLKVAFCLKAGFDIFICEK